MEIGTEISHKIRSAIKAKLVELGAYVDDELPDYIMVLVANKKSQTQMSEDLNLFLGKNTDIFTAWLHLLLTKLQAITGELPVVETAALPEQGHVTIKSTAQPEQGHEPPSSKQVVSSRDTYPEKNTINLIALQDAKSSKLVVPATELKRQELLSLVYTKQIEEPILSFTAENDEFMEEDIGKEKPVQWYRPNSPYNIDKKTAEITAKVSPCIRVPPSSHSAEHSAKLNSKVVGKAIRSVSPRMSRVSPHKEFRSHSSNRTDVRLTDNRSSKQDTRKSIFHTSSRKVPGSVVASVVKQTDESDDEYDPLNPSVGSVASVVRVTERRSSIPPAMQANKSLLMKAVNEAQKSIDIATKKLEAKGIQQFHASQPQERVQKNSRQPLSKVFSAERRAIPWLERPVKTEQSCSEIHTRANRTNTSSTFAALSREKTPAVIDILRSSQQDSVSHDGESEVRCDRQVVQSSPKHECDEECKEGEEAHPITASQYEFQESVNLHEEDKRLVEYHNFPEPEPRKYELKEFSCMEDEFYFEEQKVEYKRPLISEIPDYLKAQLTDSADSDQDDICLAVVEHSRKVKSRKRSLERAASPKFIVTLDGTGAPPQAKVKANLDIEMKSMHHSKQQSSSLPSFLSCDVSDEETKAEDDLYPTPAKKTNVLEKCKFWPICKNGDSCQYHHPSVKCKLFPKCTFGEKCLYIHPKCKYDALCIKVDCQFTHTSRKPTTQLQSVQVSAPVFSIHPRNIAKMTAVNSLPSASSVCRFYPGCHNMNCSFKHPKPCRFGISCNNKSSCNFYHPKLPGKDKLKWTAANMF